MMMMMKYQIGFERKKRERGEVLESEYVTQNQIRIRIRRINIKKNSVGAKIATSMGKCLSGLHHTHTHTHTLSMKATTTEKR